MYRDKSSSREILNERYDGNKSNTLKLKKGIFFPITFQININESTTENSWVPLMEVYLMSTVSRP